MRTYSQDLRQRILHAVDQGKPRAEIVKIFEVSRATIKRYLKLRRETGEVKAKAIPGRPGYLGMERLIWFTLKSSKSDGRALDGGRIRHDDFQDV